MAARYRCYEITKRGVAANPPPFSSAIPALSCTSVSGVVADERRQVADCPVNPLFAQIVLLAECSNHQVRNSAMLMSEHCANSSAT